MKRFSQLRRFPLLRFTLVRFGIVGLLGEGLYFLLYGLFINLTGSTSSSLAMAGGICILVNAYSHSRITFRVRFSGRLLLGYVQIQILGFGLAFLSGLALENAGAGKWLIALITYLLWSVASFLLTRLLYADQGARSKLSRNNPLP
jgi:putative flippase GtrA